MENISNIIEYLLSDDVKIAILGIKKIEELKDSLSDNELSKLSKFVRIPAVWFDDSDLAINTPSAKIGKNKFIRNTNLLVDRNSTKVGLIYGPDKSYIDERLEYDNIHIEISAEYLMDDQLPILQRISDFFRYQKYLEE